MARVTGIGGVFLRSKDSKALQDWYVRNLGLEPDEDGYVILSWGGDNSGSTVWAAFDGDADYFGGPDAGWMINYRVDDLDGLVEKLQAAGVPVAEKRFEDANGRFAHCWDPEGNKVELWEPAEGF